MASTSSATGFAGNCESTSNNGPTFAPFGRNVEGAVMANWLKAVKLEIDPVVLGQISGMMSQQPEELEVQMQQEIESISGIGKFNSPTSSFHLDATYLSSEIPRNSNELGYSHGNGYGYDHGYGCDGIPENVPQFVDPSLTFTTGYEPASSYSVAPDHRLFPSPGVDTMDALCNADILRHGAQFSEPFLFPDSIAYEPTNSAQLSQMGPNHLPTMGCGIHRPMTPDAILSDGIMTPGHSCKSTHAKNGAIHHSGAASSLVSNELITPTKARNSTVKPRNSTPATPCRQTRSKTGKHSLAETPESVNSYGAESSQSEAFSPDATTCRNGNTHVLPKGGAKAVTAKDKLIEIEAVEVMGFGFSYVRKMQDEGRSPHPTIYNSLDEAKHAQFDHLLANEHDSTIPTTVAQKKVLVGFLMVAMKDLEVTNDGKKATSPWKKKVYTDEHIEQSAWAALEDMILSQQSADPFVGSGYPKRRYDTFGERFLSVLAYLKTSKNMAKRIVGPSGPMAVANNAVAVRESIKQNKGVNDRKAERLAMEKALTKNKSPEEIRKTIASLAIESPSKRPAPDSEADSPSKCSRKNAGKSE